MPVSNGQAVTITFDTLEEPGVISASLVGETYTESGIKITDESQYSNLSYHQQDTPGYAGSAGLYLAVGQGMIQMESASFPGGNFDLKSIDLSTLNPDGASLAITFTGFKGDGTTVTATTTPMSFGFATYNFPEDFTDLEHVIWHQGTGPLNGHQFDNIVIHSSTTVPDNGPTILLLGITLCGIYSMRRECHINGAHNRYTKPTVQNI